MTELNRERERQVLKGSWISRSTDAEIRRQVWNRLQESEENFNPSKILLEVVNSEVTLKGEVTYRHEKYLAETIAAEVEGITHIHNEIEVTSPITREPLEIHNLGWSRRMQMNTHLW